MRTRAGFTVIEVVVAAASSVLIVGAVCGFARAETRWLDHEGRRLRLREASRRVLDLVAREIRGAGFAPVNGGFDGAADGLSVAARDHLEIRFDLHGVTAAADPDGVLDVDSDERIGFTANASRGLVSESVGRQGQSLTLDSTVPSDGLVFRYFDACARELMPPLGGELLPSARATVRRIDVSLTVHEPGGDTIVAQTSSALRNRTDLSCS